MEAMEADTPIRGGVLWQPACRCATAFPENSFPGLEMVDAAEQSRRTQDAASSSRPPAHPVHLRAALEASPARFDPPPNVLFVATKKRQASEGMRRAAPRPSGEYMYAQGPASGRVSVTSVPHACRCQVHRYARRHARRLRQRAEAPPPQRPPGSEA